MSPANPSSPFSLRLRQARTMRGLSYRELSDRMGGAVSHVALAKYEDETMRPSGEVLAKLCSALGIAPDTLFRPTSVSVGNLNFRKKKAFGEKQARMLVETVRAKLENYLEAEELLNERAEYRPVKLHADDAREAARELRKLWSLGDQPIADIVELLERNGIKVVEIDEASDGFDGCQLEGQAIIVVSCRRNLPVTRKRFTLAHELAHLLLESWAKQRGLTDKELEKPMNAFASEFLMPSNTLKQFFGTNRTTVTIEELKSAKLRYGISIGAIVYAMRELEMISESAYKRFYTGIQSTWRQKDGSIREPGDDEVNELYVECPERFDRIVMRGVAEGQLSLSRAAGLLGKSINEIRQRATPIVE